MIRFIDLGKQIAVDETDPDYPRQFAFFDTIYSRFIDIGGEVVFDSFADLIEHVAVDSSITQPFFDRIVGLMPDWATTISVPNPRLGFFLTGLKI